MSSHPPVWDRERLEKDRQTAVAAFREERVGEPLEKYLEFFESSRDAMENLLETTVDLAELHERAVAVLTDPEMLNATRYLASPPLSEDDWMTLSETTLAPSILKAYPDRARRLVEVVFLGIDRERFPWVSESREPDEAERHTAIVASAAMRAFRLVETWRRSEGKNAQERAVKDYLVSELGFEEVLKRRIDNLSKAPGPGQFCGEVFVGTRQADVPVRLWDGRLMPIECKVSNSYTNSYKRINNDAAVKAEVWKAELGSANVVPTAMLTGVFGLNNLEYAQGKGLTLFWAHDLAAMGEFIESTR